jgi:hypothetical protein
MRRALGMSDSESSSPHRGTLLPLNTARDFGSPGSPSKRSRPFFGPPLLARLPPLARVACGCCFASMLAALLYLGDVLPGDTLEAGPGGEADTALDEEIEHQEQVLEQQQQLGYHHRFRGEAPTAEDADERWFRRHDEGKWGRHRPSGRPYSYVSPGITAVSHGGVAGHTTFRLTLYPRPSQHVESCYAIYGGKEHGDIAFPPAFQVAAPFGAHVGGVAPQIVAMHPQAAYDSWLTVGLDASAPGDGGGGGGASPASASHVLSSVGLGLGRWTAERGIASSNGALFFLEPGQASTLVGPIAQQGVLVAQLTLPADTAWRAQLSAQGSRLSSAEHPSGAAVWREESLRFEYEPSPAAGQTQAAKAKAAAAPPPMPAPSPHPERQLPPAIAQDATAKKAAVVGVELRGGGLGDDGQQLAERWRRGLPPAGQAAPLRSCDGGATTLRVESLNDDYCDCADRTDEPGTAACSLAVAGNAHHGHHAGQPPPPPGVGGAAAVGTAAEQPPQVKSPSSGRGVWGGFCCKMQGRFASTT